MSKFKSVFKRYTENRIVEKGYLSLSLLEGEAAEIAKTRTPRMGSDAGSRGVKRGQKSRLFVQSVVLRG